MSARISRPHAAWITVGILLAGFVNLGLAAPAPPVKDPAKGEFYTTQEMSQLGSAERDRYCAAMASTLAGLKADGGVLKARLDSLTALSDTLRNQSIAVANQTREINTTLRDLRLKDKAINSYVVKKGDTLRRVASTVYGDTVRWREIYEANKAAIGAEDTPLKEGTRLTIPKKTPTAANPISPNSGTAPPK